MWTNPSTILTTLCLIDHPARLIHIQGFEYLLVESIAKFLFWLPEHNQPFSRICLSGTMR